VALLLARRGGLKTAIPFGPYMLAGAWVAIGWGDRTPTASGRGLRLRRALGQTQYRGIRSPQPIATQAPASMYGPNGMAVLSPPRRASSRATPPIPPRRNPRNVPGDEAVPAEPAEVEPQHPARRTSP
jgi:hypothetical protein